MPAPLVGGLLPLITFAVSLAACLALRQGLFRWMDTKRPSGARVSFADVTVNSLRTPSIFWCLVAALAIAIRYSELAESYVTLAERWMVLFVIASITLAVSNLLVRATAMYGEQHGMPFATSGLSRTLIHLFVFSIGAMTVMRYLGLEIAPLLTALGVGGLAVALALKDTLANLFAGVHILMEKPIAVGDFIALASGEEGIVKDIGWRTTRLQTGQNNTVVVPNEKITSSILTNHSLPDPRVVGEVTVVVAVNADYAKASALAVQAAQAAPGVLKDPPPMVMLDPGVLPTHIQFKLLVWCETRLTRAPVLSDVRGRLLELYRKEKVPLPQIDPRP